MHHPLRALRRLTTLPNHIIKKNTNANMQLIGKENSPSLETYLWTTRAKRASSSIPLASELEDTITMDVAPDSDYDMEIEMWDEVMDKPRGASESDLRLEAEERALGLHLDLQVVDSHNGTGVGFGGVKHYPEVSGRDEEAPFLDAKPHQAPSASTSHKRSLSSNSGTGGTGEPARKHVRTSTSHSIPYITLSKLPASQLASYKDVPSTSIDAMARRTIHNTAPAKRAQRSLDAPTPWEDLESYGSLHLHPKFPPTLATLFKECEHVREIGPVDESWPCLGFFKFLWLDALQSIFCKTHHRLIPGNYIWKHLSRSHPEKFEGITRADVLNAFLYHLMKCHPSVVNQSTHDVKQKLPMQLEIPLPRDPDQKESDYLKLRYQCPEHNCTSWIQINESKGARESELRRHVKNEHPGAKPVVNGAYTPKWTEEVEIGAGKFAKRKDGSGDHHYFTFPPKFTPGTALTAPQLPSIANVELAAPSTQTWATKLGWEDELSNLAYSLGGRRNAAKKLLDLTELPSKARIERSNDDVSKALEHALLLSNRLNLKYLKDGAEWVMLLHPTIRRAFSHLPYVLLLFFGVPYAKYSLGRSHFRLLMTITLYTNTEG